MTGRFVVVELRPIGIVLSDQRESLGLAPQLDPIFARKHPAILVGFKSAEIFAAVTLVSFNRCELK